jgi:sirohydrochlorin cobaltochelatase
MHLFLGMGRHAREDLPQLIGQLRQSHPDLLLELLPAAGEMPELTRCLAQLSLQSAARP